MNRTAARSTSTWRVSMTAGVFFLIIGFLLFTEHRAHDLRDGSSGAS